MYFQATCSRVPFVATRIGAHKGFLACVSKLVCLKMTFGDEVLVAAFTAERTLTSVGPHMRLEVASFCELLQTLHKRTNQKFLICFWPLSLLYAVVWPALYITTSRDSFFQNLGLV
jgi:hypothetical protein